MRTPPTITRLTICALLAALILAGCDIMVLKDWDGDRDNDHEQTTDPSLFSVTLPAGGEFLRTGDTLTIAWDGSAQPYEIDIDLYRSGAKLTRLARVMRSSGRFFWTIPADFDGATEVADEYQIVASGFHPSYPNQLRLVAYSGKFTIEATSGTGLSDVEVSSRTITVTLTDDGSAIDGDTIDLYLNGARVADDHVLAAAPGTQMQLFLQAGANTLEVVAVNEGSVSPNTALLEISDVIVGDASQQWRLGVGEWGSLSITAP